MRISDWSSDVCSSDLRQRGRPPPETVALVRRTGRWRAFGSGRRVGPFALEPAIERGRGDSGRRARELCARCVRIAVRGLVGSGGRRFRPGRAVRRAGRSEEHTSELQSLMRISYAVFCLKKKNQLKRTQHNSTTEHTKLIYV